MKCLEYAMGQEHIMDFTRLRALGSLFSMLKQAVRNVITYNQQHTDFPMEVLHYSKVYFAITLACNFLKLENIKRI